MCIRSVVIDPVNGQRHANVWFGIQELGSQVRILGSGCRTVGFRFQDLGLRVESKVSVLSPQAFGWRTPPPKDLSSYEARIHRSGWCTSHRTGYALSLYSEAQRRFNPDCSPKLKAGLQARQLCYIVLAALLQNCPRRFEVDFAPAIQARSARP